MSKDITISGQLSQNLPGYETRPSQERMAEGVSEALARMSHLIVEAGTGTGKSLAYLIPLVANCVGEEKRAVVSTYTKALQKQLVEKDLPFIKEHLNPELRYTLCLGSDNYLCMRRLEKAREHGGLFKSDDDHVERLLSWAAGTQNGIRQGSGGMGWHLVARQSDNCHGRDCRYNIRCFYQKARQKQKQSHILVVNHHLYFADMATSHHVLPAFDTAVFDEAHELEDVAADYLGIEVSNLSLKHLFNSILSNRGRGLLKRLRWLEPSDFYNIKGLLDSASLNADDFFGELESYIDRQTTRIYKPNVVEDVVSEHLLRLGSELDGISKLASSDEQKRDIKALASRCAASAGALRAILAHELDGHVYWAEKSGRVTSIVATPIDIAGMRVFDNLQSAVYTSATLSTGGGFDYIKERLGLEGANDLKLKSHFNYKKQAKLYLATDLPAPNTPAFEQEVIKRIGEIIKLTQGRTLVLFTSYKLLNQAADAAERLDVDVLRQGEDDSYNLIERFKANDSAVLFGTYTFWQGIDVPGDALKCVVITRLPFAVPDEPIVQARMELLERMGREPFMDYQVPRAAITLKQGFGRLIRSSTDTGTVAILDSRVKSKFYGKFFLDSLPDAEVITSLDDFPHRR